MYADIVKKNPGFKIYRTTDKEFVPFGYVIKDIDSKPFIAST
jgi:hypothetical protein